MLIRSFLAIPVGVAAMLPLAASAQTTIRFTTPGSSATCVFTSDAQGVRFDAATGQLLAAGSFGAGCPSGTINSGQTPAPSFTNNLTSGDDTVGPVTLGSAISLTWAADADACAYTATPAVTGWSGAACSDANSCAKAHSFTTTPTVAGSYGFSVSCTRRGISTPVTSSAAVTVNPEGGGGSTGGSTGGGTACAGIPTSLTRQVVGLSTWLGSTPLIQWMSNNELTAFKNVWGREPNAPVTGTTLDWPGRTGVLTQLQINKNRYLSLQFTVPADTPRTTWGTLQGSTSVYNSSIKPWSMTISHSCYGEFDTSSPNLASDHCASSNQTESGGITWSLVGNAGGSNTCQLKPGETYYLNIIHAPLTASDATSGTTSSCTASSCAASINNSFNLQ